MGNYCIPSNVFTYMGNNPRRSIRHIDRGGGAKYIFIEKIYLIRDISHTLKMFGGYIRKSKIYYLYLLA